MTFTFNFLVFSLIVYSSIAQAALLFILLLLRLPKMFELWLWHFGDDYVTWKLRFLLFWCRNEETNISLVLPLEVQLSLPHGIKCLGLLAFLTFYFRVFFNVI